MGSFYSGSGGYKSYIGHCEDGIIYRGSGNGNPIGRYEGGSIYNQFKEHVGSYSGGSIYNASGKHIASYENGIVYNSYLNVAVGKEQIGSYDGNPAEAAALVLLFIGGSHSSNSDNGSYSSNSDNGSYSSGGSSYSSGGDSDCGVFFALLAGLFNLIILLVGLLIKPFCFLCKYFYLPFLVGGTIYCWGAYILSIICGFIFAIPIMIIMSALYFISFPYWAILFWQKIKRRMTWKECWKYYKLWFFKGPWAYPYIIDLKNNGPQ